MIFDVTYMSGAGNLFTVIDGRKYNFEDKVFARIAPVLCSNNFFNKLETEGLLLVGEHSNNADFKVRFYNPDGSSGMMCGNGARCAVRFGLINDLISIENKNETIINFQMASQIYQSKIIGDIIEVVFPTFQNYIPNISINIGGHSINGDYVNVGSDHFVINFNELRFLDKSFDNFDIDNFGKIVRMNERFMPMGVNANFYIEIEKSNLKLRTFERGVEKETGACGTGAISTALSYVHSGNADFPITLVPTSGIKIKVDAVRDESNIIKSIILSGPAVVLSQAEVDIPDDVIF